MLKRKLLNKYLYYNTNLGNIYSYYLQKLNIKSLEKKDSHDIIINQM